MSDPIPPEPPAPSPADPAATPAAPAPSVVPLVGARIPADHGLSGLGLIMQLGGTLFAAATSVIGLISIIYVVQFNARFGGADNTLTLWALALVVTGVVRAAAHRNAGTRLLYEAAADPFGGIRRYLGVAAIQTIVWLGFYALKVDAPAPVLVTLALMLGAWPATLAVIIRLPRFKRFAAGIPLPEDKGFEGAAILMLIFGLTGLGFGLVVLYTLLQAPSMFLAQLMGILLVIVMVMLVIRSCLHVVAGWRGVAETDLDRAAEATSRYGNFGVVTALVAASAVLLMMMAGGAEVAGILFVVLVGWLLIAWPLIIRRFFSERQFADLLAGGDAPIHRRAPDRGHTSLGWLLLALGVMAMSTALPSAVFGERAMGGGDPTENPFAMIFMMMPSGFRSPWWAVGTAALQLWAAFELIRMSDHHRLVASIFGAIAAAVAIYVNLPMLDAIDRMGLEGVLSPRAGGPILFGALAIGLVVPVGTLILVNRKGAPTAQARYRTPVAPAEPMPPSGTTKSS